MEECITQETMGAAAIADGSFTGGITSLGLADGGIALSTTDDLDAFVSIGVDAGVFLNDQIYTLGFLSDANGSPRERLKFGIRFLNFLTTTERLGATILNDGSPQFHQAVEH